MLVIRTPAGEELLIPFVRAYLRKMDIEGRRLEMDLPRRSAGHAGTIRKRIGVTAMRFDIITIFPGFFAGIFEHGVVKRAIQSGLLSVAVHDLRAVHPRSASHRGRPALWRRRGHGAEARTSGRGS